MMMNRIVTLSLALTFALTNVGCSSFGKKLKAFLGGRPSDEQQVASKSNSMKFSDNQNVYTGPRRQYKRTTKQSLQEEAALDAQSGSLWVMEGQGAYLFSQNIMRMIGDPIGVQVEGEPKEQLQSKVDVIKKLWARYEDRQAKLRAPAAEEGKDKAKDGKETKDGKDAKDDKAKSADKSDALAGGPSDKSDFSVKTIPARIVERTIDGNYRVKGSQPFMIGSREYKVIVTGVVRSEDFNDEGISASKLIDPKFDVVSARRKEQEL